MMIRPWENPQNLVFLHHQASLLCTVLGHHSEVMASHLRSQSPHMALVVSVLGGHTRKALFPMRSLRFWTLPKPMMAQLFSSTGPSTTRSLAAGITTALSVQASSSCCEESLPTRQSSNAACLPSLASSGSLSPDVSVP